MDDDQLTLCLVDVDVPYAISSIFASFLVGRLVNHPSTINQPAVLPAVFPKILRSVAYLAVSIR